MILKAVRCIIYRLIRSISPTKYKEKAWLTNRVRNDSKENVTNRIKTKIIAQQSSKP